MRERFAVCVLLGSAAWGLFGGAQPAFGTHEVLPPSGATIKRNPVGASVNPDGATTVFITFGALPAGTVPGEALWCGEVAPAGGAELGNKCVPGTIFGRLPARFDRSALQGGGVFTDIMAIPASVARRALQSAQAGHSSNFFYVRQFLDTTGGGANQYITVTCEMVGSGASVPLSLNDVRLYFEGHADEFIYAARRGEAPPPVKADIVYNGTGRLRGRWEIVFPGETLPTDKDLMTEGSLTQAERLSQQKYALIERFDEFLPPTGKYTLKGPDPKRIPTSVAGLHTLLLRVETSNDNAGNVDLALAGAGVGIEHHGAVANFPIPILRYTVAAGEAEGAGQGITALTPGMDQELSPTDELKFEWSSVAGAAVYRLVIQDSGKKQIMSAVTRGASPRYVAPFGIKKSAPDGLLQWQVTAVDKKGREIAQTGWMRVRLAQ